MTRRVVRFARGEVVFAQGGPANSVFYIQDGGVKLSVLSSTGREAVVAMLSAGDFFGEGCLAGQPLRMGTATAVVPTSVLRIQKREMARTLHERSEFSDRFLTHMLSRNIRIEEDLVDQLFNSSEKRLARTLLLLARYGKEDTTQHTLPKLSQETLAEMVGTTRSRVNFFMNKFRKLGLHRVQRRPENQQLPPQRRPPRLTCPHRVSRAGVHWRPTDAGVAMACRRASGARVFIHGAAATPTPLVEALSRRTDLADVTLYHLHTAGPAPFAEPGQRRTLPLDLAVHRRAASARAIDEGRADFVPVFLSDIPRLFTSAAIRARRRAAAAVAARPPRLLHAGHLGRRGAGRRALGAPS